MAVEFQISGVDNVEQILRGLPLKYAKKPMQATFRKAARVFSKELRKNTPKGTGETRKAIKVKAMRGLGITAGFTAGGAYMPSYFKAYWANYGTYEMRASGHTFKKGRKAATAHYKGGAKPLGFVETSWEATKKQVQNTIETELKTETLKFLNKYKVN